MVTAGTQYAYAGAWRRQQQATHHATFAHGTTPPHVSLSRAARGGRLVRVALGKTVTSWRPDPGAGVARGCVGCRPLSGHACCDSTTRAPISQWQRRLGHRHSSPQPGIRQQWTVRLRLARSPRPSTRAHGPVGEHFDREIHARPLMPYPPSGTPERVGLSRERRRRGTLTVAWQHLAT